MPFDDGDDLTRKPFQHMRKYGQSYQQQLQFSPQSSYSSCHVLYNVVRLFSVGTTIKIEKPVLCLPIYIFDYSALQQNPILSPFGMAVE